MIRRSLATLALTIATLTAVGCNSNPVGAICDLGTETTQPDEVVLASPSLDCISRTCLKVPLEQTLPPGSSYPSGNNGLCTAECSSDGDCDRVPESPCQTGFTCGIAVDVGPFCCKKFCICKDYVIVPASGELETPAACDPTDTTNTCCNLPGRDPNCEQ